MRTGFAALPVFVAFLLISSCAVDSKVSIRMLQGPYLIYEGDDSGMTLLWQLEQTASCTLEWGTDTRCASGSVQTSEYGSDHRHKHVLSNLANAVRYYYRIRAGASVYSGTFLSAPASTARHVKFLAYGDSRTLPWNHDAVCAQMIDTYTRDPAFRTFTLHAGDFVSDGDKESDWATEFFPRLWPNIMKLQSELPIQGCRGNHEGSGTLFYKYYPYPYEPGGFYWSFDYGPVHAAIIDQYEAYHPGSTQYAWLENDLAGTDKEWIFLLFHEPGWSAGGHANNPSVQNDIQPLCVQYGVDIVFCGHNHYYARAVVEGVQHITTGGGGAPFHSPQNSAAHVVSAKQSYHFCEIDIKGSRLLFTARDQLGAVIDSFTLPAAGGTSRQ